MPMIEEEHKWHQNAIIFISQYKALPIEQDIKHIKISQDCCIMTITCTEYLKL